MCLYPKLIRNKKYLPTKKNNYNPILMQPVEGAITKNGKQHHSFYGSLASHPELADDSRFIRCSCKQCIGCRLENSRQWAVRAVHEARSSSSAYFVTCTFDDCHLPRDKSLSKKFHQTFMKNLRREYGTGIVTGKQIGRAHV